MIAPILVSHYPPESVAQLSDRAPVVVQPLEAVFQVTYEAQQSSHDEVDLAAQLSHTGE